MNFHVVDFCIWRRAPPLSQYRAMRGRNATPDKRTFVMKLAAPTINDGTHEWMKGFASAIERAPPSGPEPP
jgi:hypothetical protein